MTSKTTSAVKRGLMMILSPAKTLNLNFEMTSLSSMDGMALTEPMCNVEKTNELVNILKTKTKKQLKDYMGISDNLVKSVLEVSFVPK